MSFDAKTIANCFLDFAKRDSVPLGPMKIQKLVYLAHGWNLAFRGEPLIKQEVEAWKYGPVVPDLYREFKRWGSGPIRERAEIDPEESLDDYTGSLLNAVWKKYKAYSGAQLSALTHETGSAWYLVMRESGPFESSVIPVNLIFDEFQRRKQGTL